METQEIHDLVRRAQTGDKMAKTMLLETFRPLICRAGRRPHLATVREDAEQEAALAFLWAMANFDELRGVPFAGFAKAMVFGRVRTFFQHERRKWQREILPVETEDENGEKTGFFEGVADERDEIGAFEEREAFRAALSSLPEREQKILTLYYEKGLPLRAIGARLGMTDKHVSVVKARAMKKLRATLGAERARHERMQKRRPRGRREGG
ncbi:MAG: sigma-70 family RNA polymerase sigma factor [Schwartzia sp.]|nr:sigma-70 family RNA polymerase sigma factor [Schwartzia sp. (in: firmicutes)]